MGRRRIGLEATERIRSLMNEEPEAPLDDTLGRAPPYTPSPRTSLQAVAQVTTVVITLFDGAAA